jgi:hypothetical protein
MALKSSFAEYETVEIVKLNRAIEEYNGWGINVRPAKVGDHGDIVHIYEKDGQMVYVVESENVNGVPQWLGVFAKDEIRSLNPPSAG